MKAIFKRMFLVGTLSIFSFGFFFHQSEAKAQGDGPYFTVILSGTPDDGVTASDCDFSDGQISITSPATLPSGATGTMTISLKMVDTGPKIHMSAKIGTSSLEADVVFPLTAYAYGESNTGHWFDMGNSTLENVVGKGYFKGVSRFASNCHFEGVDVNPDPDAEMLCTTSEIQSQYSFYYF